jgi:hypothetical protein
MLISKLNEPKYYYWMVRWYRPSKEISLYWAVPSRGMNVVYKQNNCVSREAVEFLRFCLSGLSNLKK